MTFDSYLGYVSQTSWVTPIKDFRERIPVHVGSVFGKYFSLLKTLTMARVFCL